jgi:hypothetical protein
LCQKAVLGENREKNLLLAYNSVFSEGTNRKKTSNFFLSGLFYLRCPPARSGYLKLANRGLKTVVF